MLPLFFACSPLLPDATTPPQRDTGWQVIGASIEGRDIRLRTVGHGPHTVLWIGGIHGDEPEGRVATAALPSAFLSQPDRAARITLHLIEDLNPDGRAAKSRANAAGVDLNRNYPTAFAPSDRHGQAPLDQPEAAILAAQLDALQPEVVLVAHSWRERHFINYDGPAAALAETFSAHSSYPVVPSEDISPTPGSLGSWIGREQGIPILTVEYKRGTDPQDCWGQTQEAILAVLEPVPPR